VKKTEDAMQIADHVALKSEAHIDREIANMAIDDNVQYVTINLVILQPEKVYQLVIANIEKKMSASYGVQIQNALKSGWNGFKFLIIGVIYLWPLWLIGLVVLFWIKRRSKAAKPLKSSSI